MPDLFHSKAIDATLEELRRAAQQAQVTAAAASELIQNANALVEKLARIVDAIGTAGEPRR